MDSYFIRFSFGQSIGKAGKFICIFNLLDVLRESLILVSGRFHFDENLLLSVGR